MKGLLFALALFVAGPAMAEYEIRGVGIGATQADVMAAHPDAMCREVNETIADSICSYRSRYGGASALLIFRFLGDRVSGISAVFDSSEFEGVRQAMETRYGKGEASHSIVRNAMGATFDNHVYEWRSGDHILKIEQRSPNLTTSTASLNSDAARMEVGRRVQQQRLRDASEL